MRRIVLAALLAATTNAATVAGAVGAPPDPNSADTLATPDQVFAAALRQSIGAPARADIGDQATVRLADGLILVPAEPAARLLAVLGQPVPTDLQGLLVGSDGMDALGVIRFVPAGFVDADAALAWTAEDMLASLDDTVQHANPDRVANNLPAREARRWVVAPHYDPEQHLLAWAALILPSNAPRDSDGAVTYHAVAFGREGSIRLSVVGNLQKADAIAEMETSFLGGLHFRPNKAYGDVQPTDRRAPSGLAGVMAIDRFHKAPAGSNLLASDTVVPIAGGIVAAIGALSLLVYIKRHLRREARRG